MLPTRYLWLPLVALAGLLAGPPVARAQAQEAPDRVTLLIPNTQ